MPVVTEIAEALKLVGDVVKSTREVIDAINDKRKYLKRYHPTAEPQLGALLAQMPSAGDRRRCFWSAAPMAPPNCQSRRLLICENARGACLGRLASTGN